MQVGDEFLVEDQGDGWWHCPSPLRCRVLDGPAEQPNRPGSTYVLVTTDPPIEWHGSPTLRERLGADHLSHLPIEPTRLLVLLNSSAGFTLNAASDYSVPAYPVLNHATTVREAEHLGLGVKVSVRSEAT